MLGECAAHFQHICLYPSGESVIVGRGGGGYRGRMLTNKLERYEWEIAVIGQQGKMLSGLQGTPGVGT